MRESSRCLFGSRQNSGIAQIQFTFLGTSSAVPTLRRNVTSSVLRLDGEAMVFDVGEGTQHQLMRSQSIRQGKIKRLFVTHLHGDHLFGLPGLVTGLCGVRKDVVRGDEQSSAMSSSSSSSSSLVRADKLRIYGPRGIREFLACALRVSHMKIPRDFYVHELVESAAEAADILAGPGSGGMQMHDPSEPPCNTVVPPTVDSSGCLTWNLFHGPTFSMRAGSIVHTVPCWGYVFTEKDQPGALDLIKLMASPLGGKRVGPWLAALKNGQTVDGVTREEVCGPTLVGRKVVVLGDTCDPSGIAHLAQNCNLLVHEVTMRDANKSKAFRRGHSTASMAGQFAASIHAHDLAVTHFGGEISANAGNAIFPEIAASVKKSFGRAPIFARDFLTLQVERRRNVAVATAEQLVDVEDSTIWNENEDEHE